MLQTPFGVPGGCHLHGVGRDQEVGIVKECDTGHLNDEHVDELDGQHEHQLPDAADLQEHGAGQQAEQHAVGEVLRREGGRLSAPPPSPAPRPSPGPAFPWAPPAPPLPPTASLQSELISGETGSGDVSADATYTVM